MCSLLKVQLQTNSVKYVPLNAYESDFVFIVNGEKFKTNKFISDLISKRICLQHQADPTLDIFEITTENEGNFENILNLANFTEISISENELPFFREVMKILDNNNLSIPNLKYPYINEENIVDLLKFHENFYHIYSKCYLDEIEFASSNFFSICKNHESELSTLSYNTICEIINHDKLQLENEDQLLNFINFLYEKACTIGDEERHKYSYLYDYVQFSNVSKNAIKKFYSIYNINDIDIKIWNQIIPRLIENTNEFDNENDRCERYGYKKQCGQLFEPGIHNNFAGIINYIKAHSNGNIENRINVISSTIYSPCFPISNLLEFNDKEKYFQTLGDANDWICYDFKEQRVKPTHYQIVSHNGRANLYHPKNWVIEGSIDETNWDVLDCQINCSFLNGPSLSHTFPIRYENLKEFRYIRMRLIIDTTYLRIHSFELYGSLI